MTEPGMLHSALRLIRNGECSMMVGAALALLTPVAGAAQESAGERRWMKGEWSKVASIPPDSLLQPFLINSAGDRVVLFDYGDTRVKAFALDGHMAWTLGRKGQGPWEFGSPMDLQVAHDGRIWIADPANKRISVIRPDGQADRMISPAKPVVRFAPLSDGGVLGRVDTRTFFERFDRAGATAGEAPLPEDLEGVHPLAAEPIVRTIGDTLAAVAFRWSSALLILGSDGAVRAKTRGVETLPFPETRDYLVKPKGSREVRVFRTDPKATWAAYGMTIDGPNVLVLFRGASDLAGRIIDVYRISDAGYLGSMLLPAASMGLAMVGKDLAVLLEEPEPHVDILRWRPKP